jgi:hypothetical protein
MSQPTPSIARVHGFVIDSLLGVVSCWFWARQVLLLFYPLEASNLVKR